MSRWRPPNDTFDVDRLVADLEPYAKLRSCPFDWEFNRYLKSRRQQAPDREGLTFYYLILTTVLMHAPSCFPKQKLLRCTWLELSRRHCIKDPAWGQKKPVLDWANECADSVRICTWHLLELKRSRTQYVTHEIKTMLNQIVDPSVNKGKMYEEPYTMDEFINQSEQDAEVERQISKFERKESATKIELARQPTRTLAKADSLGSNAEICSVHCCCPSCRPIAPVLDIDADEDMSDHSAAAHENTASVAAARGMHKKQVKVMRGKPAASTDLKVKICFRTNPPEKKESYILVAKKYYCHCTLKQSARYLDIIQQVAKGVLFLNNINF